MCGKLKKLMSLGGFNPTKWISNKREVIDAIPESELSKELKSIDYQKDTLPVERALGVHWNVEADNFNTTSASEKSLPQEEVFLV